MTKHTGVSGSTLTWLFTDIDGTVDTQTVATTGATTQSYRDPFGVPLTGTGVWGDGNGYLNHPSTTSTGLSMLGARAYNPLIGKFTYADLVLIPGNPIQAGGYAYSGNNPITLTDPDGKLQQLALSDGNSWIGAPPRGGLNYVPGAWGIMEAAQKIIRKGSDQLHAALSKSIWTITPRDISAAADAYGQINVGEFLQTQQGQLIYGWANGSVPNSLAFGSGSDITKGLRDSEWGQVYEKRVRDYLANDQAIKPGGYSAGRPGLNPNFTRDMLADTEWSAASNVDRSLAVIGSFDLNASVIDRVDSRTAKVRFTATNDTSLGSALRINDQVYRMLNGLPGSTGPFSRVTESFSWTDTISW